MVKRGVVGKTELKKAFLSAARAVRTWKMSSMVKRTRECSVELCGIKSHCLESEYLLQQARAALQFIPRSLAGRRRICLRSRIS
eukprot:3587789-Rhodomonas_salina.1